MGVDDFDVDLYLSVIGDDPEQLLDRWYGGLVAEQDVTIGFRVEYLTSSRPRDSTRLARDGGLDPIGDGTATMANDVHNHLEDG